jgi:cold shock protein
VVSRDSPASALRRAYSNRFVTTLSDTHSGADRGGVRPSLDSPPGGQHNAYTFFAAVWNRAEIEDFSGGPQEREAHVERLKGTVKWFNNAKGYGFLGRDDGPDVFIHYSSITTEGYKSLQEGDQVEFEIVQGQKGPQAANVTKIA